MSAPDLNDISAWQYDLPEHLIATRPAARRDDARLMLVDTQTQKISHHRIRDLPELLQPGDRLVFNDTKVLQARLLGFRTSTKGRWEGLFLEELPDRRWRITGQTRGRLRAGESLTIEPADHHAARSRSLQLLLEEQCDDGTWIASPCPSGASFEILESFGTLPLPPYIGRSIASAEDRDRYQTVFAQEPGAIAAPTAGLHFTPELLASCAQHGIEESYVTLHVGIGTFRPVSTEKLSDHRMHFEWCRVPGQTAADVLNTKAAGHLVTAVGTTTVRTLEAAVAETGSLSEWQGRTDLFIQPGFRFQVIDRLLTNFHLPGSTLIVLVAALAGYDLIMEAYRVAVEQRYRFYSYGDAMLIA
ncbi:MAG: tRNA preQ1(34) S-adenosylmethionine ribosyltransferase-isomerase QueA [Planctomycetaceae bacterium]